MASVELAEIEYPTTDGKPMAETDIHRKLMIEVIEILEGFFANATDVYVSGNMLIYYEEGNPRRHRAPDVFVARGVAKHEREIFKPGKKARRPTWSLRSLRKPQKRKIPKRSFAYIATS
jgi:hypothetical protein